MQFRNQGDSYDVERWRIDENRFGLPLYGCEADAVQKNSHLRSKRLLWVNLTVDIKDLVGLLAGELLDALDMRLRKRMGKV